ncbi:YgdI/YgdR family lipoprotein [Parendozoicomonas sp. Alg238-R29]|uniref:YgdI/YgdR family lipoprotein n=1 Tax=Parendozoicomonas sp. Alg238-R29 TaxID=2993446 RepID=UPI00248DBEB0|nr:YgdI/YgdR family lipoprotein [Parendozoicomonas sp. Alg238-R29]
MSGFDSFVKCVPAGMILASVFLTACSTPHVVKLKDGREFISTGQPDYDDDTGFYEFKTPDGREMELNRDLIESIHSK